LRTRERRNDAHGGESERMRHVHANIEMRTKSVCLKRTVHTCGESRALNGGWIPLEAAGWAPTKICCLKSEPERGYGRSGAFSFERKASAASVCSETCDLGLRELERATANRRSGDGGMEGHDGCIRDGHRSLSQGEIVLLRYQPHPPFFDRRDATRRTHAN